MVEVGGQGLGSRCERDAGLDEGGLCLLQVPGGVVHMGWDGQLDGEVGRVSRATRPAIHPVGGGYPGAPAPQTTATGAGKADRSS
jgi:hypothetical protein